MVKDWAGRGKGSENVEWSSHFGFMSIKHGTNFRKIQCIAC